MNRWEHRVSSVGQPESGRPAAGVRLGLSNNRVNKMIACCDPGTRYRGGPISRSLLNDALEHGPCLRRFHCQRRNGAQSAHRALQNILAASFCFHLPARLFRARCSRLDPGFFSHGP